MNLPHDEVIVVVDFGSQTTQLIARRIREAGVFSVIIAPDTPIQTIRDIAPKGIVLSGGPASVYDNDAPNCDKDILKLGVPVLGICYGMQLACSMLQGTITPAPTSEFGRAQLTVMDNSDLLSAIPENTTVWMSHGDQIGELDQSRCHTLARTNTCPHAAIRYQDDQTRFFGVQFHPEVTHTPHGSEIIQNFLYEICKCSSTWHMADFADREIEKLREQIGQQHVICGLSGGVDSAVVAALLHKAIGPGLTCVFVDTGLLRKNERELVQTTFRDHFRLDLRVIDAGERFLTNLKGIDDPQEKRRRIGHRFISEFKDASNHVDNVKYLAQGTLYPDVIESGQSMAGPSAGIKLHHNVGGLPEDLGFDLIEPLRDLFKDEVRKLGQVLGLPNHLVWRHPFPGPGLAVRVLGDITEDKLLLLQDCDEILLEEIVAADLYRQTSQVFAVLLPVKSVGVMGDGRTYESVVAIRAVETRDFMTADWARIPFDVLGRISNRIINEVKGVNRVVYDISSKPPATIEWE